MSFNIRNILCLFVIIIIYQSFYSQHSEENIDYIKQKEIELTNDSSYWDNHSILYFGFNRVGLYNWAAY